VARKPALVRRLTPLGRVVLVGGLAALAGLIAFGLIPTKFGFG
jgi:hypothetical protein